MGDLLAKIQGDEHKNTIIIGGYYRRPVEGDVVLTYGGSKDWVHWQTDDHQSHGRSSRDEMDTWEFLEGVRDFPDAKDPRLPYEFDLHYDVHTLSQLVSEFNGLANCLKDKHIKAMCKSYGIDLRNPQTIRDYNEKQRQACLLSKPRA